MGAGMGRCGAFLAEGREGGLTNPIALALAEEDAGVDSFPAQALPLPLMDGLTEASGCGEAEVEEEFVDRGSWIDEARAASRSEPRAEGLLKRLVARAVSGSASASGSSSAAAASGLVRR